MRGERRLEGDKIAVGVEPELAQLGDDFQVIAALGLWPRKGVRG